MNSSTAHGGRFYSIQLNIIKHSNDLRKSVNFFRSSGFHYQKTYEHDINWDIVGRGVKLSVFSNGFCLSYFFWSLAGNKLCSNKFTYCGLLLFSVVSISEDCQKRKCSLILEFFVDLKFTNDFSYLCLWLLAKFHGLVEPTKITKKLIFNEQCRIHSVLRRTSNTYVCEKEAFVNHTATNIHHILQTT